MTMFAHMADGGESMVEKDMNEEVEIDFQRIFGAIWRKIWM